MFKQNGLDKARVVKESQQKERDNIDIQIKNIQKNIIVNKIDFFIQMFV